MIGSRLIEARRRLLLAWLEFSTAERRTAWSLLKRGFLYRREPALIREGRKPDYLTFGRGRMWVEVKALDPPPSRLLLETAGADMKVRLAAIPVPCRVDAQVSGGYDQRAASLAARILQRQLEQVSDSDVFYVGIPRDTENNSPLVTLEWHLESGAVRMLTPRSASRMYGFPRWVEPDNWSTEVTIRDSQTISHAPAHQVLHGTEPCVVMLRVERQATHRGLSSISGAEAVHVKTVDQLRDRIKDAAAQLRNGQTYLRAPGVVALYADHLGVDHSELFRACLGDLTVSINPSTSAADPAVLDKNGVMRPNKNRAVSAVTYSSRQFATISLINPHATLPIAAEWLAGTVYRVVLETGQVVVC